MSDWMITLSGPLAQRSPLLASLDRAGVDVDQEHGPRGLDTGQGVGWITARHTDVDEVVDIAQRSGWALRMHSPTPTCRVCAGTGKGQTPDGLRDCTNCAGVGRTEKLGR